MLNNGKITQGLLDSLTEQAKSSPRLRMNLDLRNSDSDNSQRMLNAIEPDSVVPIHRHQKSSETVVCLRGHVVEEYYDELERTCTEAIELTWIIHTALRSPAKQKKTKKNKKKQFNIGFIWFCLVLWGFA